MWEEKTDKIIGRNNNNKLFVRSITYSGNAVSAFPLNNLAVSWCVCGFNVEAQLLFSWSVEGKHKAVHCALCSGAALEAAVLLVPLPPDAAAIWWSERGFHTIKQLWAADTVRITDMNSQITADWFTHSPVWPNYAGVLIPWCGYAWHTVKPPRTNVICDIGLYK